MKIFFIDESNIVRDEKVGFFVYGGLIVDCAEVKDLVEEFLKIKSKYSLKLDNEIKWRGIKNFPQSVVKDIKNEILDLVQHSNCKIIIYLAPQSFYHSFKITTKQKDNFFGFEIKEGIDSKKYFTAFQYATNVCLQKFNQYLINNNDYGMVLADKFGIASKEMMGYYISLYPGGTEKSSLSKIVYPIISLDSSESQIHQMNDVVLGAIQYSLIESTHNFLPILKNNFWSNSAGVIKDNGVNIYPKTFTQIPIQTAVLKLNNKFFRLFKSI